MIALLLALVLQAALVPEGDYNQCSLSEAGSLDGPAPRGWTMQFYEIANYTFVDQPGLYELRGYKVHWISGPLKDQPPGDYDPTAKSVRFKPAGPGVSVPVAAQMTCALKA